MAVGIVEDTNEASPGSSRRPERRNHLVIGGRVGRVGNGNLGLEARAKRGHASESRQPGPDIKGLSSRIGGNVNATNRGVVRGNVDGISHRPGGGITRINDSQAVAGVVVLRNSGVANVEHGSPDMSIRAVIHKVEHPDVVRSVPAIRIRPVNLNKGHRGSRLPNNADGHSVGFLRVNVESRARARRGNRNSVSISGRVWVGDGKGRAGVIGQGNRNPLVKQGQSGVNVQGLVVRRGDANCIRGSRGGGSLANLQTDTISRADHLSGLFYFDKEGTRLIKTRRRNPQQVSTRRQNTVASRLKHTNIVRANPRPSGSVDQDRGNRLGGGALEQRLFSSNGSSNYGQAVTGSVMRNLKGIVRIGSIGVNQQGYAARSVGFLNFKNGGRTRSVVAANLARVVGGAGHDKCPTDSNTELGCRSIVAIQIVPGRTRPTVRVENQQFPVGAGIGGNGKGSPGSDAGRNGDVDGRRIGESPNASRLVNRISPGKFTIGHGQVARHARVKNSSGIEFGK